MLQTTNYQLNQWDAEDRVLRTDFNADNAKIDAAIAGVRAEMPVVKLLDIITAEEAVQVDADLTGVDLTPYSHLQVEIHLTGTMAKANCCVRCNGLSSGYVRGAGTSSGLCLFYMGLDASACIAHLLVALEQGGVAGIPTYGYWTNNFGAFYNQADNSAGATREVKPDTLEALNFVLTTETLRFAPGSRFIVRGVRY